MTEEVANPVESQEKPQVPEKKPAPEKINYAEKLRAIEEEKIRLAEELENFKTEKLKEENNYKTLYERSEAKRIEAEKAAERVRQTFVNDLKMKKVREEALKNGIHEMALDDLDLLDNSLVQIETTSTGKYSVLGAAEFIEDIKSKRPYWFRDSTPPNVNNGRPSMSSNTNLSPSDILKLEKENPAAYNKYMRERYSIK